MQASCSFSKTSFSPFFVNSHVKLLSKKLFQQERKESRAKERENVERVDKLITLLDEQNFVHKFFVKNSSFQKGKIFCSRKELAQGTTFADNFDGSLGFKEPELFHF